MTDTVTPPIVVSENAATKDTLAAAGRYITVVVGVLPGLMLLIGARNVIGIMQFLQTNEGLQFIAAVGGLASIVVGLLKTNKRGAQLATAAVSPAVPDSVVTTPEKLAEK